MLCKKQEDIFLDFLKIILELFPKFSCVSFQDEGLKSNNCFIMCNKGNYLYVYELLRIIIKTMLYI